MLNRSRCRLFLAVMAAIVGLSCFILDQVSKSWAFKHLTPLTLSSLAYKPFIPGLLHLTLVTNTGGAFGFGCGNNTALALLAAAIMTGVFIWVWQREKSGRYLNALQWCGVGFLAGGALGNLWDRLTLGYVIDFLDFAFINFPVFNLSDVFVDIGIGLIVLGSLRAGSAH